MGGMLSVVVPYYNGKRFIKEALTSIDCQTYKKIEIIIVNDGSDGKHTEELERVVSELDRPTKIIHHEKNQGISATRNTGIEAAEGEFIAIHDQDDVSLPKRFERQISKMETNPSLGTTMTNVVHIGPDGDNRGVRPFDCSLNTMNTEQLVRYMFERWNERGPPLPLTTEVSRTEVFETVGGYNTDYYGANDQEFLFRVAREYEVHVLDDPLVKKRYHGKNAAYHDIKLLTEERKMTDYITELFPQLQKEAPKRNAFLYLVEVRKQYKCDTYRTALYRYIDALRTAPFFTIQRTVTFILKYIFSLLLRAKSDK